MEISFLVGKRIERTIHTLMVEYDQFHWAVAWGTCTSLARQLVSRPEKVSAVTFGLAFAQTDPDLVEALVGFRGCFVVTHFPPGTFHPKVYAFRSGKRVAAVIGSPNFTTGGMVKNREAAVSIVGSMSDKVLVDTLSFVERSATLGQSITAELASRYRIAHKLAKRRSDLPRDPLAELSPRKLKALTLPLVRLDWDRYTRKVWGSGRRAVIARLDNLRIAQAWLSAAHSFHDLTTAQRKAIAGVLGEQDKVARETLNRDWGLFGSMGGAGEFSNRVAENDRFLARAVDSIPQKGEIIRKHYDRFSSLFQKAFQNSTRSGGVSTASRLLAMKRPDVFLCISRSNVEVAARAMGFAKSTLKIENYWERVVEVIRASDWYNAEKPESLNGPLWEYRAAMLDTIFYRHR